MRTVTLVVFGRADAQREWLKGQEYAGRTVRLADGVVQDGEATWIARRVQDESDYRQLMALELSDVIEHPSFDPPPGWREFIACRVRLPCA